MCRVGTYNAIVQHEVYPFEPQYPMLYNAEYKSILVFSLTARSARCTACI
jgi:hypothetical protein